MRKLCPACINRQDHVVHPECPVCEGTGHLVLGEGAMSLYTPEVVSKAVELGLEAAARIADMTRTLSDDRQASIKSAIDTMRTAGLLAPAEHHDTAPASVGWWTSKHGPKRTRNTDGRFALLHDPSQLAADTIEQPVLPLDMALSEATPYNYQEHERPGARGLPIVSDTGHPSSLARITDPMEPGRNTGQWVRDRALDGRRAAILHQAASEAAAKKRAKQPLQQRLPLAS